MWAFLVGSCLTVFATSSLAQSPKPGVMIMAHGGSEKWNAAVRESIGDLRSTVPVEFAFGMANPETMAAAVDSLLLQGVDEIIVVRLFASAESFLEPTRYILGLTEVRPEAGMYADTMRQLDIPVPVKIGMEGLLDAAEVGGIIKERALTLNLSTGSKPASVLIIAHGAGPEEENDRWLARMDSLADSVRSPGIFEAVKVETLREDWDGPRAIAEDRIRAFAREQTSQGRQVIVIPFRLFGFGPYAEVLEGLPFKSDGRGLIPDARVGAWVSRQVLELSGLPINR
jgi:sirohydrochlorin cobaltochelatase